MQEGPTWGPDNHQQNNEKPRGPDKRENLGMQKPRGPDNNQQNEENSGYAKTQAPWQSLLLGFGVWGLGFRV